MDPNTYVHVWQCDGLFQVTRSPREEIWMRLEEEKILRSGDSPEIEEQGIVGAGKISFPYLLNFQKETT